jgi:two-component system OmpR family response regulator
MSNVLVVEDDSETRHFLRAELQRAGYGVAAVGTLRDAKVTLSLDNHHVVILDRMLPDGDGLVFIEELRVKNERVPVLVLSALGDVNHRVDGLRAGGDDYLVKPFAVAELIARVEVLCRRAESVNPATEICVAGLQIDLLAH